MSYAEFLISHAGRSYKVLRARAPVMIRGGAANGRSFGLAPSETERTAAVGEVSVRIGMWYGSTGLEREPHPPPETLDSRCLAPLCARPTGAPRLPPPRIAIHPIQFIVRG